MSCPRPDKRRFTSRKSAKWHLRQLQGRGRAHDGRVRVYRCPAGDHWHIGRLEDEAVRTSRSELYTGRAA